MTAWWTLQFFIRQPSFYSLQRLVEKRRQNGNQCHVCSPCIYIKRCSRSGSTAGVPQTVRNPPLRLYAHADVTRFQYRSTRNPPVVVAPMIRKNHCKKTGGELARVQAAPGFSAGYTWSSCVKIFLLCGLIGKIFPELVHWTCSTPDFTPTEANPRSPFLHGTRFYVLEKKIILHRTNRWAFSFKRFLLIAERKDRVCAFSASCIEAMPGQRWRYGRFISNWSGCNLSGESWAVADSQFLIQMEQSLHSSVNFLVLISSDFQQPKHKSLPVRQS